MLSLTSTIRAVCIGVLWMSASANAQVPAAFVGNWKGSWQTEARTYEAAIAITTTGGTWQTATRNQNNPCAGREIPIKVESSTATSAQFVLQFSEVIAGCQNVKVTMILNADGTVTGTRSRYELTLVKK
jgi:hypothetical protein